MKVRLQPEFGVLSSIAAAAALATPAAVVSADLTLYDWTQATFDADSSISTNPYYELVPGTLAVYEGVVDEEGAVERIEVFVTFETKTILGVETRVIRDTAYIDDVLVEIAYDWYAQATDGTVWYFGEFVENFEYDDDGNLIEINNDGSWIADDETNFPGVIMRAAPQVDDGYFQEFAPGVAFDFAIVESTEEEVEIDLGSFDKVLSTAEGNLFDGPEIAENKLYAPGTGLVLIEELDDRGEAEFFIELILQIDAPSTGDINGDLVVDAMDLSLLLQSWGPCGICAADVNHDGQVDADDLGLVLSNWD